MWFPLVNLNILVFGYFCLTSSQYIALLIDTPEIHQKTHQVFEDNMFKFITTIETGAFSSLKDRVTYFLFYSSQKILEQQFVIFKALLTRTEDLKTLERALALIALVCEI